MIGGSGGLTFLVRFYKLSQNYYITALIGCTITLGIIGSCFSVSDGDSVLRIRNDRSF